MVLLLTQYSIRGLPDLSGNLTLFSHLHCAVQFPRSIPVLGATRHYFTPDFGFCKSVGRFFMKNRAFFADFAPVAARRGRGIPHGEAMCARCAHQEALHGACARSAHMDATGSAAQHRPLPRHAIMRVRAARAHGRHGQCHAAHATPQARHNAGTGQHRPQPRHATGLGHVHAFPTCYAIIRFFREAYWRMARNSSGYGRRLHAPRICTMRRSLISRVRLCTPRMATMALVPRLQRSR